MTKNSPARRQLTLWTLVAAAYFMVAGGPYGLEDVVQMAGYGRALLILALTPLIWSLPVALMVGELSAALPDEGGYYVWVRRAFGQGWGFMEAWLSLVASIFDMAIYPTLFLLYLGAVWPWAAGGWHSLLIGAALIAVCAAWNARGAWSVGEGSLIMLLALLAPFVVLCAIAVWRHSGTPAPHAARFDLLGGVMVAIWNYMGWDNVSTVAGEVERPQRTYPLAMMLAVTLVAVTYLIPVGAMWFAGLDASRWTTGGWVEAARLFGGPALGLAVAAGGMLCGAGMLNALILSYTRVPMAMAEDGLLPRVFTRRNAKGAPWVSIVVCSAAWAACLTLGFERLIELDVLLYGGSLLLEFAALIFLRMREPELRRPFRVPGGIAGCALMTLGPTAVLILALLQGRGERAGPISALTLGLILMAAGPVVYWATTLTKKKSTTEAPRH